VETSDDPVIQRQRRLGQALAEWRKAAGISQGQLARRLSYDRTTVAHAERGAQVPAEDFWRSCDAVLAAEGTLVRLYEAVQEAKQRKAEQAAARARADRWARLAGLRRTDAAPSKPGQTLAVWKRDSSGVIRDAVVGGGVPVDPQGDHASLPVSGDEERLLFAARNPRRLDRKAVEGFAGMLASQRRLEDDLGSAVLIEPVTAQLAVMAELVSEARGPLRPVITDLAAQYAQFCGWLSASAGRPAEASNAWLDRALEWAAEAGNTNMIANVMSFKGHIAWVAGRPGAVIGLSAAARRDRRVFIAQRAYDAGQEARGHAMTGDSPTTDRLLDEAADLAERAADHTDDTPPWQYYYSPAFFTLQRGLAYRHLAAHHPQRNKLAVDLLTAGLAGLPDGLRGAEWAADFIHQLAIAHTQAGEPEQACARAAMVAAIGSETSSERLLTDARRLHARLAGRWREHTAVAELGRTLGVQSPMA
jgi:transcriptional regulator with XRE-family HTH domain